MEDKILGEVDNSKVQVPRVGAKGRDFRKDIRTWRAPEKKEEKEKKEKVAV